MKKNFRSIVVFMYILFGSSLFGDQSEQRAITKADSVLAIYRSDWRYPTTPESLKNPLILAIWKDGYIVWSDDRLKGGEPYHAAKIDPKRLESLLSSLEHRGAFDQKNYDSAVILPDSQQIEIFMKFNDKAIRIVSCHELFESSGKAIAAEGVTGLNEKLYDALRSKSAEHLLFRVIWNEIRARSAELVPSVDKTVNGELKMHRGIISWVEDSKTSGLESPKDVPPKDEAKH